MNILTLTEAQQLHTDAVKQGGEEGRVVGAILEQLITHLETADKVIQITASTNSFAHAVVALKGDGTLWRTALGDKYKDQPMKWEQLPQPE